MSAGDLPAAPGSGRIWRPVWLSLMPLSAFPVLYAKQVERVAGFYMRLGFTETFRFPDEAGAASFIALTRETSTLGVTTEPGSTA